MYEVIAHARYQDALRAAAHDRHLAQTTGSVSGTGTRGPVTIRHLAVRLRRAIGAEGYGSGIDATDTRAVAGRWSLEITTQP